MYFVGDGHHWGETESAEELLKQIVEIAMANFTEANAWKATVLVLDDLFDQIDNDYFGTTLKTIATKGRHKGLQLIIATQYPFTSRNVGRYVRTNVAATFVCGTNFVNSFATSKIPKYFDTPAQGNAQLQSILGIQYQAAVLSGGKAFRFMAGEPQRGAPLTTATAARLPGSLAAAAPIAAAVPVPQAAAPPPLDLGGYVSEDGSETTPAFDLSAGFVFDDDDDEHVCSNCGASDATESNSPDWFCASCWELLNDDD